ncbi:hypothetical protein BT69DRAFT_814723 [Atractiella rhizophila]|nr:hypothetical protein BT69DRAFT_814723 [Atractiella rhizophila]
MAMLTFDCCAQVFRGYVIGYRAHCLRHFHADLLHNSALTGSLPDHYLLRSLLRSAVSRTLSVLLSRLSALLLPLLSLPLSLPVAPKVMSPDALPAPQKAALDVAAAAWAVADALCRVVGEIKRRKIAGTDGTVSALEGWKVKFEEIVNRVMLPVVDGVKKKIGVVCNSARIEDRELVQSHGYGSGHASPRSLSPAPNVFQNQNQNQTCSLPNNSPTYVKELAQILGGAKSFLVHRFGGGTGVKNEAVEKWIVGLATACIWKSMLSWSARSIASAGKMQELEGKKEKEEPPSPPGKEREKEAAERLGWEMGLVEKVVKKLVDGVIDLEEDVDPEKDDGRCPPEFGCRICSGMRGLKPDEEEGEEEQPLAKQALEEAYEALKAVMVLVKAFQYPSLVRSLLQAPSAASCHLLARAFDVAPPLITLYLIHSRIPSSVGIKSPHEAWGMEWESWTERVRGFAVAEEWTEEAMGVFEVQLDGVALEAQEEEWVKILDLAMLRLGGDG